jgi:hypothetical protein
MSVTRNSKLGPSHLRAKKRRLFLVRVLIILFFSLVILFSLAIFSSHEKVVIKNISIVNNVSVSEEEILDIVNQALAHRYWYLFARRNFLIFPRLEIKKNLLAEIKTIKEVNISWSGWQSIIIEIEERKPHSVYCGADILAKNNDCFFVDYEGYIYSLAPDFSGSIFIKNYSDNIEGKYVGKYFLNYNLYTSLFKLIDILKNHNIKVVTLVFEKGDFKFILDSGLVIIFNHQSGNIKGNSFDQAFTNLFTAISTNDLDLEAGYSKIEYIDLRFDNKIIIGKKDI